MIRAIVRMACACLAFVALSAQTEPLLVPEISQHEVEVRQGFTGTNLLLYGAVLDPRTRRADRNLDIVVVLKGPSQPIRVREKRQIGGVWVNADSTTFRSAPSFFAVASSRPIARIVDPRTAAIFEFGTEYIQLSPSSSYNLAEQTRFREGLVDLRRRQGLYKEEMGGVTVNEGVLYQARITLPSNVQTGTYVAETFAVSNGRVVASATAEVQVLKVGFERFVELFSQIHPLAYGLVAIALSLAMGWFAGRVFSRR